MRILCAQLFFLILPVVMSLIMFATGASADILNLGNASLFVVLGLPGSSLDNSLVTIQGNEGISQSGTLTNMAPLDYQRQRGRICRRGILGSRQADRLG